MDAATINARIYAGRAKAAARIGFSFNVCRPTGTIDPLANVIATIPAAFSPDGTYKKPNLYGKPTWQADLDGSQVQVGDYLVSQDGTQTYFIAAKQSLLPIVAVECNAALRLTRPPTSQAIGAVGYSGLSDADLAHVDALGTKGFIGWPCSLLQSKGAERFAGALPSSPHTMPGWQILFPPSAPARIVMGDRLMDVNGQIYSVQQAERTDMGWRIVAAEVHA